MYARLKVCEFAEKSILFQCSRKLSKLSGLKLQTTIFPVKPRGLVIKQNLQLFFSFFVFASSKFDCLSHYLHSIIFIFILYSRSQRKTVVLSRRLVNKSRENDFSFIVFASIQASFRDEMDDCLRPLNWFIISTIINFHRQCISTEWCSILASFILHRLIKLYVCEALDRCTCVYSRKL